MAEMPPEEEAAAMIALRGHELAAQGRWSEALPLFNESVKAHKQLAEKDPERFQGDVAAALNNVGMCFLKLSDFLPATYAFENALEVLSPEWEDRPEILTLSAAPMLASLAALLAGTRHFERAMRITDILVPLRRSATEPGVLALDPDLAKALRQYAQVRIAAGLELDRILSPATEALTIYQHLAERDPTAFGHELMVAYDVFAEILDRIGRKDDAEKVRSWLRSQTQS